MTSNPLRILQTLDRHLHGPIVLYVYGRSALALGYPAAPAAIASDDLKPTRFQRSEFHGLPGYRSS